MRSMQSWKSGALCRVRSIAAEYAIGAYAPANEDELSVWGQSTTLGGRDNLLRSFRCGGSAAPGNK